MRARARIVVVTTPAMINANALRAGFFIIGANTLSEAVSCVKQAN